VTTQSSFTGLRHLQASFHLTAAVALAVLGTVALRAADASTGAAPPAELAADAVGTADVTTPAQAGSPEKEESLYDRIWGYTELYSNKENKVIQSLALSGRFQLDYATVNADQGHHEEWNIRRFRLGAKATLFQDFVAHVEVDLNPQEGDTYQRLTDAYLAWGPSQQVELTIGKHSAPFTMDGQTSSKKLLTIDRSNLANNLWFTEEYIPGISLAGEAGSWVYQAGAYSSGISDAEFGNVADGVFGLGTIGYNFKEAFDVKEALLRVNYVYNAPDNGGSGTYANRPLEQIASLNFSFEDDAWGVRTDLTGGLGYGSASDVWGAMVMPWYNLSKHFQIVARYTFVRSINPNGVRFARYESELLGSRDRGDEYQEWYMGVNWYLYGHKLKLQTGFDYAHMADRANDGGAYNGWGWTTGLRLSW
jgi:phosphate-selective porin OprO/OprP